MGRPKGSKNKKTTVTVTIEDEIINQSQTKTTDEVAEEEKKRALEKGWSDPDFDFRELYRPGDTIYFVWMNHLTNVKQLMELHIRTIYARSMVAWEDKGCARVIGYPNRDWIFLDRREAESYYKSLKMEAENE